MALTDTVPSQAIDVFKRNMEDSDRFVNQTSGTVTNRTGKTMRPLPVISDDIEQQITDLTADINAAKADLYPIVKFRFLVDSYTITNRNELGDTVTGETYRYIGATLPFNVTPSTNPVGNPDFVQVIQTDHNNLTNRNAVGAHDASAIQTSNGDSVEDRLGFLAPTVSSIKALETLTILPSKVIVSSFYPNNNGGGGTFLVLFGADLSLHDGFNYIAMQAINAWVGSDATTLHSNLTTFFAAQTGTGVLFQRIEWFERDITLSHWGALGSPYNDNLPFKRYNESALSTFNGEYQADYRVNQSLTIKTGKKYFGRFAKITCEAPSGADYHFLQTGEGNGDGKHDWLIRDWEFVNEYVDGVHGHTRKCIWVGDDSSNFKVSGCKFTDFYWNVQVSAKDNGPANQNGDLSYRVPSDFELSYLKSDSTLSNAVFIIKGPKKWEVHHCEFNNVGVGSSGFGHGILVDFVSASEGSGDNGIKCSDGKIYNNKISNTRQGGITNAGNNHISIYENTTSEIGSLTGGTGVIPINVGYKYGAVPIGGHVSRNNVGAAKGTAISVSGEVDVLYNDIEDACIESGTAYINLGTTSAPWQYATAGGNTIKRVNGLNVAGLVLQGVGSGVGCTLLPNHFKGAVQVESRYLGLQGGATIDPTLTIVSQEKTGKITASGNGSTVTFTAAHGIELLDTAQIVTQITAGSADAASNNYVTVSGSNISITYLVAPPTGVNNVVINWTVHNPLYLA